jgi:hypothetical protein
MTQSTSGDARPGPPGEPASPRLAQAMAAAGSPDRRPNPGDDGAAGENPAFIRLAMRNMVRKGRQSLVHFGLTALGLTGFLVLLAWLGRPQLPQ